MTCPDCATENQHEHRYCRECGKELAAAGSGDKRLKPVDSATALALATARLEAEAMLRRNHSSGTGYQRTIAITLATAALTAALCAMGIYAANSVGTRPTRLRVSADRHSAPPTDLPRRTDLTSPPASPAPGVSRQNPLVGPVPGHSAVVPRWVPPSVPMSASSAPRLPSAVLSGPDRGAELAPAAVRAATPIPRNLEPSSVAKETAAKTEPIAVPRATHGAENGDSLIDIQVLEPGSLSAPTAHPVPPRPSGRLGVTIEGNGTLPRLVDAAEHLRQARHHLGVGRKDEAAVALAEAERLYKLIAGRGGRDAASAETGLDACRWLLNGLR